ncbi:MULTISPECIES: SDR family NAD(P)-dependent oxidoreductase [unclassified Enterococcus]|uniref:SDR family NAD(P)-dependent oxidoreductase n=1 Tax=unclassified Enterococcus TaxID=2608891 RepID=UPI00155311B0|nr:MULTISPECIES: SDR family NAD(P)-dependent oxidoreductase [unclassified Enterococcus]MBS7577334.1 SDR family oxidoreductase [Enterococcus sp. MMGLQ5-2]MBS7584741.1 SDR family oxidoreductase [Enterococcus sp. MMGLQ5-1]NPD12596.1 SDR family oxidoreductase [Enterococcus sp. MMGLQ5-1]NPD37168.1 SDR family oxidoreductase [Enterococcus sp. MMGLQ5-2]
MADKRFEGRNVLVTGGSRGIGLAITKLLLKSGANVVFTATNENSLAKAESAIAEAGLPKAFGIILDLNELKTGEALFETASVILAGQSIDILINNAGIGANHSLAEIELSEIQRIFQVNLTAPILLSQAFAKQYQARTNELGSIINISSIASRYDDATNLVYGISKSGVNKLTKNLAKNLGKSGIRVNAILPGSIETDMTREKYSNPAVYQALVERLPLSRRGKGQDIAKLVCFLASDDASYITGQLIAVDGGWLLQ